MASTTDQLIIELVIKTLKAQEALRDATKTGKDFDESLKKITTSEQALNRLGIQTQAQIQQQIELRRDLIQLLGSREPQAVAALSAQVEQLTLQQQGLAVSSRQAEQALFGVGFILDDARQFTVDFSAGLRAISNNIQPLIQNLSSMEGGFKGLLTSLKGPAGLIIAFNTLSLLIAVLAQRFKDSNKEVKEAVNLYEDLASAAAGSRSIRAWAALENAIAQVDERIKEGTGLPGRLEFLREELDRTRSEVLKQAGPYLKLVELLRNLKDELGIDLYQEFFGEEKRGEKSSVRKEAEDFSLAIEKLRQEQQALLQQMTLTQGGFRDEELLVRSENEALQEQITLLENLALARQGVFGARLQEAAADVTRSLGRLEPRAPGSRQPTEDEITRRMKETGAAAAEARKALEKEMDAGAKSAERFQERLAQALGAGLADAVAGFSENIGKLIAGQQTLGGVFTSALVALADLAIRIGKIIFLSGIGIEALKKSLQSFTGVPAIVAGLGLIAIGAAAKGALASASGGAGSSASARTGPFSATPGTGSLGGAFSPSFAGQPFAPLGADLTPGFGPGAGGTSGRLLAAVETLNNTLATQTLTTALRDDHLLISVERGRRREASLGLGR